MRVLTLLSIIPRTAGLLIQLLWILMTLGWHVRKARRAFERELIGQGISKEDAERISKQFEIAKDNIMSSVWNLSIG